MCSSLCEQESFGEHDNMGSNMDQGQPGLAGYTSLSRVRVSTGSKQNYCSGPSSRGSQSLSMTLDLHPTPPTLRRLE